jgi:hypothetical protein
MHVWYPITSAISIFTTDSATVFHVYHAYTTLRVTLLVAVVLLRLYVTSADSTLTQASTAVTPHMFPNES